MSTLHQNGYVNLARSHSLLPASCQHSTISSVRMSSVCADSFPYNMIVQALQDHDENGLLLHNNGKVVPRLENCHNLPVSHVHSINTIGLIVNQQGQKDQEDHKQHYNIVPFVTAYVDAMFRHRRFTDLEEAVRELEVLRKMMELFSTKVEDTFESLCLVVGEPCTVSLTNCAAQCTLDLVDPRHKLNANDDFWAINSSTEEQYISRKLKKGILPFNIAHNMSLNDAIKWGYNHFVPSLGLSNVEFTKGLLKSVIVNTSQVIHNCAVNLNPEYMDKVNIDLLKERCPSSCGSIIESL